MSAIADVLSIVGFITSAFTMFLSLGINRKLKKQRFEILFKSKGNALLSSFNMYSDQLNQADVNLIVLRNLKKETLSLLIYAQNCKWGRKKREKIQSLSNILDDFIRCFMNEKDYDEILCDTSLQLFEVISILSEEVQML